MENKISRRSNFATATSNSNCMKSDNNKTNSGKRDVLAELTNSLIPTEVLLDLCSNSTSTSKANDLLRISRTSALPISRYLQNSKSDSKSNSSIGSSNVSNVRDAQNTTPVRHQLPNSSSGNLQNEGCKLAVYGRRKTSENSQGRRKLSCDLAKSAPVKKKTRDEEKIIPVHFSTTPSYKEKNKQKASAVPLDLIHSEKERAKEKGISVPLSSVSVGKLDDKVQATGGSPSSTPVEKVQTTTGSPSSTPVEKAEDKGKAIALPLSFYSAEKRKNKGKTVADPFSSLNKQADHKEKSTAVLINHPLDKKGRGNVKAAISSCPPLWRTRRIRNKLNKDDDVKPSKAWSDPHPKNKKRRCSEQKTVSDYSLSEEFEKQKAYFQEIDAFELPVEEVSGSDLD